MKKTKLTKTKEFPFVEKYVDYHYIMDEIDVIRKYFSQNGVTIMGKEVAFDGNYWGLFWIRGKKPSKNDLKQLLLDEGYEEDLEYADIYD